MMTFKMMVIPFVMLSATVAMSARAGAEPGDDAEAPAAGVENMQDLAASSCPGVRIEHIPLTPGGPTLGFLDVYFDAATGNNCAMTVAVDPAAGAASFIDVCLNRCKETTPGKTCTIDVQQCDAGAFHFFAGPVTVHAPGKCISAFGDLIYNGKLVSASLSGATHCG